MFRFKLLRQLRRLTALFFLLAVTACFLDFTGQILRWCGWTVRIQLMPAALALSVAAAAILAVTLLFGRIYCSAVCPLGILQDIAFFLRRTLGWLFPVRRPAAGRSRPRALLVVRISIAVIFFSGGFLGLHFLWLEPYGMYGRMTASLAAPHVRACGNRLAEWAGERVDRDSSRSKQSRRRRSWKERQLDAVAAWAEEHVQTVEVVAPPVCMVALSWSLLVLILALAVWRGRVWCNTICPVGTALGCLSRFSLLRPKIDPVKCVKCRMCEKVCKTQSIDVERGAIDLTTCVACFDCGAVCKKGALKWSR